MKPKICIFAIAATAGVLCSDVLRAQGSNLFTVVSPAQGQVFAPGTSIPITVQPAPGITLSLVTVFSRGGTASASPPGPLSTAAPQDPFGPLLVSILGQTASGDSTQIDVTVVIESTQTLVSIIDIPSSVALAAGGTSKYLAALGNVTLDVLGTLADGTQHNITSSTKTTYATSNPLVGTVDSAGNVTAVAPGRAQITVTNKGDGTQTPVSAQVPLTVNIFELRGDLDGDNDVDTDDLAVLEVALNTPATGPGDPRDLNNDGKINQTDLDILKGLCSRKNCATQ